jgi:hypothetical protein
VRRGWRWCRRLGGAQRGLRRGRLRRCLLGRRRCGRGGKGARYGGAGSVVGRRLGGWRLRGGRAPDCRRGSFSRRRCGTSWLYRRRQSAGSGPRRYGINRLGCG